MPANICVESPQTIGDYSISPSNAVDQISSTSVCNLNHVSNSLRIKRNYLSNRFVNKNFEF